MNWIGWVVVIIIIATLFIELISNTTETYTLPIKDDESQLYEISFPDKSKLLIYTAKDRKAIDQLEQDFREAYKGNPKMKESIREIEAEAFTMHKKVYTNNVQVEYSSVHGVITQVNDAYKWGKTTINEISQAPAALAKAIVGAYVYYNYWLIMVLFKYANNDGRIIAYCIKPFKKESLAEKVKIVDYLKIVRLRTTNPINIRRIG